MTQAEKNEQPIFVRGTTGELMEDTAAEGRRSFKRFAGVKVDFNPLDLLPPLFLLRKGLDWAAHRIEEKRAARRK